MNEFSTIKPMSLVPSATFVRSIDSSHSSAPQGDASAADSHANKTGKVLPPHISMASAKAADDVQSKVVEGAPEANKPTEAQEEEASQALASAVETMNDFVQTVQRDLHFSVDADLERTVVKVVDGASGDVIRQIPEESFLELARKMKEHGEVHLVNATG